MPPGGWNELFVVRPAVSVPVVLAFQRPDLHEVEEPGRRPGQERKHLLKASPLDMAWLAGATLGVGRALEAGDHLEVRLVLAGSVALGVAGAGLVAVAEGNGAYRMTSMSRVISCCSPSITI